MPSLDFVYDLAEKISEEKMNYLIIIVRRGEDAYQANVFDNLHDEEVKKVMCKALTETKKNLTKRS